MTITNAKNDMSGESIINYNNGGGLVIIGNHVVIIR